MLVEKTHQKITILNLEYDTELRAKVPYDFWTNFGYFDQSV